ncbi:MAG: hypothetical protein AAGE96_21300, partial [Cyanobacteria bacterium P01_G01_bin.19]
LPTFHLTLLPSFNFCAIAVALCFLFTAMLNSDRFTLEFASSLGLIFNLSFDMRSLKTFPSLNL